MPEFGVLDGVEWSLRRPGGDRFGVSLGAMPEPNADHDTGQDLLLAAFYTWVDDVDMAYSIHFADTDGPDQSDKTLLMRVWCVRAAD